MAPSSNASEQGFSGWVAKPPRMRTACTQCHAAKIRCSGDKSGCQRCNTLGLHCEYVVSMVGRTPKRQRKTSEARSQRAHPSPPASTTPTAAAPPAPAAPPQPASRNNSRDSFDVSQAIFASSSAAPPPLPAPTDFSDDQLLFDYLNDSDDTWATSGVGASCQMNTDDDGHLPDAIGFEIEGFSMPPDLHLVTSGPPTTALAMAAVHPHPHPPPPPPMGGIASFFPMSPRSPGGPMAPVQNGGGGGGDGQQQQQQGFSQFVHVVALCKMVRLLESQAQTRSRAVDEVMKLNQACIRDVTRISSRKEYMRCRSCPALISTIMDLVVTLYEDITKGPEGAQQGQGQGRTARQTTASTELSLPAAGKPHTPSLQFGVFELDPEEQTAMRNNIIRKEAQKCVQVIQVLKRLLEAEIGADDADRTASQSQALGNWYDGMEERMSDLISSLTPSS